MVVLCLNNLSFMDSLNSVCDCGKRGSVPLSKLPRSIDPTFLFMSNDSLTKLLLYDGVNLPDNTHLLIF